MGARSEAQSARAPRHERDQHGGHPKELQDNKWVVTRGIYSTVLGYEPTCSHHVRGDHLG